MYAVAWANCVQVMRQHSLGNKDSQCAAMYTKRFPRKGELVQERISRKEKIIFIIPRRNAIGTSSFICPTM